MIINLYGTVKNDVIEFEPAPVYFEQGQCVQINEMVIHWKNNVSEIHGLICSTMVDLCPINPKQQLIFFKQTNSSTLFHYSPTHTARYIIQCPSLQSSVFQIQLSKPEKIEKIYLQLEISNARNKQVYSQSF